MGHLFSDKGFQSYMLELPWRDNKSSRSCIPNGTYEVKIRISPKYGRIFHVTNVQGRNWILTHSGNWAGNVDKGHRSHSEGCLLFGARRGILHGQMAVLNSRSTKAAFERHMEIEKFQVGETAFLLHIMEV